MYFTLLVKAKNKYHSINKIITPLCSTAVNFKCKYKLQVITQMEARDGIGSHDEIRLTQILCLCLYNYCAVIAYFKTRV